MKQEKKLKKPVKMKDETMKNSLHNAIKLYSPEQKQIDKLKIDYILTEDKQEKQALRIVIISLENNF